MRFTVAVAVACLSIAGGSVAEPIRTSIKTFTNIPAQPLAAALQSLARERDFQVLYRTELVDDARTQGAVGELTAEEALNLLLSGTGLGFEYLDEKTVRIVLLGARVSAVTAGRSMRLAQADSSASAAVKKNHSADPAQARPPAADKEFIAEEITVFGTMDDELSVGSKSGLSLRETPKSVTVVTRERIEAQNLTSMFEALGQTTGITMKSYSPAESFVYSRGFRVQTLQIDGGAPAFTGNYGAFLSPDMAQYEQVQMLRGVDGMYTGAGEPGGIINLVRKRAKGTTEFQTNLSAGRWDFHRAEADVTGALTDDGRLRGRFVAAYQEQGYFYDRAESEKTLVYGTAEYDITPSTLLLAGGSYERRKEDSFFNEGFPRYSNGGDLRLPRETAFNPPWSHWYVTTKEAFARVEQSVGDVGMIKLNFTRLEQQSEGRYLMSDYPVDPVTLAGPRAIGVGASDAVSKQDLVDLFMSGEFPLFGREHRYTVGVDYSNIDNGGQKYYSLPGYDWPGNYTVDVFNFDPAQFPEPEAVLQAYYPEREQSQRGFYAAIGLQLAEPLRLTLGGRYGKFRYDQVSQSVSANGVYGVPSALRYRDEKFIPSVALTWDFAQDWSAYASYAETFKVQANNLMGPRPGTPLDPITGDGYEVGVKGELFGLLNLSAAIYRIQRDGQAVADPTYGTPSQSGANGSNCCYLQGVNIITEGFDAEASGTVLPGWQMFAGYTYATSDHEGVDASTLYSSGVYNLSSIPKHMFKMWTTLQLPGALSRWTVNTGVITQTEASLAATTRYMPGGPIHPYKTTQGGYSVWNASLQYRITDNWSVSLYGDNLFDKRYYQVIGSVGNANFYGQPRNYVLRLNGRW